MLATMSAKLSAETLADDGNLQAEQNFSHPGPSQAKSHEISQSESKLVDVNLFPNG